MKIAFIPTDLISYYSGDGINVGGGQIASVNPAKAEKLLTDLPDNFELLGDDTETKDLRKKLAEKLAEKKAALKETENKVAKEDDENKGDAFSTETGKGKGKKKG